MMSSLRVVSRYVLSIFMVAMGALHFVAEDVFMQIVPPFLPAPRLLVWLSGVAEIALGVGLIPVRFRRWAGYGLVTLYVAVFPANLYMALANVQLQGMPSGFAQPSPVMLWLRLPGQLVLIAWALWASAPSRRDAAAHQQA
jgi:uncharacterized membrane protein